MCCHKVLDFAGRRLGQCVASDEVGCQVVLGRIATGIAVCVAIDLGRSSDCVGHVRSRAGVVWCREELCAQKVVGGGVEGVVVWPELR